ncbi:MAG: class IV adenylate cyclase [Ignavibacteria bacterium]
MKNFELKVKCKDHRNALNTVKKLNAKYEGILKQKDVYFNLTPGRLKLRTINNTNHQLIFYKRSNRASAKFSNYYISEITHPKRVRKLLKEIFGIKVIVSKTRKLYIWQNVRIHIDSVNLLGKFIEFEVVCKSIKDERESREKMKHLRKVFKIPESNILKSSYSDMLIKK